MSTQQPEGVASPLKDDLSRLEHPLRPNGNAVALNSSVTLATEADSDFISDYAEFADVFELPRKVHESVAIQLIASALNGKVFIRWGSVRCPLDVWMVLLSESGQGRNTATDIALKIVDAAGIEGLIKSVSWGSAPAFYDQLAQSPEVTAATSAPKFILGVGCCGLIVVAYGIGLVRRLHHPWTRIAIRIAGSWVAAAGLMVLALTGSHAPR